MTSFEKFIDRMTWALTDMDEHNVSDSEAEQAINDNMRKLSYRIALERRLAQMTGLMTDKEYGEKFVDALTVAVKNVDAMSENEVISNSIDEILGVDK